MLHIHTYLLYTHLCICIYEVVLQMYMLYCIYMKTNKRERERTSHRAGGGSRGSLHPITDTGRQVHDTAKASNESHGSNLAHGVPDTVVWSPHVYECRNLSIFAYPTLQCARWCLPSSGCCWGATSGCYPTSHPTRCGQPHEATTHAGHVRQAGPAR